MENDYNQFNEEELRKSIDDVYDEKNSDFNEQLEREILFTLIGNVNAGKSSVINAVMGEKVAQEGAKPGETIEIKEYRYQEKIMFVDTPGLHDIIEENSEKTLKYYKKADVILFVLNAAGEVFSAPEQAVYNKVKKYNDHIIFVLNKIDAAENIPSLIEYVGKNTDKKHPVIAVSSRTGENIDVLECEIMDFLEKKHKELLFANLVKHKAPIAKKWILAAATSAGAVGLSPLPGSDIIPITSIQVSLLIKLGILYDKKLSKERAQELVLATITGNMGKTIFRQIVKTFPGVGLLAGGGIAFSLTLGLGLVVKYAYENEIEINQDNIMMIYKYHVKDLIRHINFDDLKK